MAILMQSSLSAHLDEDLVLIVSIFSARLERFEPSSTSLPEETRSPPANMHIYTDPIYMIGRRFGF
jgi:hypothetical protein